MPYFESRLPVDFNNFAETLKKLEFCERLGIKNVILEPRDKLNFIPLDIKEKIKRNTNINIFYRINLRFDNLKEFKKRIKLYNNFSEILSVESFNKDIQIQAARDSRVDILSFSNPQIIKTITPGVISLTRQNNSFLEFSLNSILITNKVNQSKNFRNLYRFIHLALKNNAYCIISGNFDELYDLRHPRALMSICNSLLGIPLDKAKKIFMTNPILLLERIKKRYDGNLELGVKLIRGGD
ncbi:MAG: RNase P subunit p30 family protein [Promethearchaeota archaeon]